MKMYKSIILILVLSVFPLVYAHEEPTNCEVDLEAYAEKGMEFINNNQEDATVKYAKSLLGNNVNLEISVDNEVWHTVMSEGLVTEVGKGAVEDEDFSIYISMCTLHNLEEEDMTLRQALENNQIMYEAHGLFNTIRAAIISLFL